MAFDLSKIEARLGSFVKDFDGIVAQVGIPVGVDDYPDTGEKVATVEAPTIAGISKAALYEPAACADTAPGIGTGVKAAPPHDTPTVDMLADDKAGVSTTMNIFPVDFRPVPCKMIGKFL